MVYDYDCFIAYSSTDERFAHYVASYLQWQGLNPFMARFSLQPGQKWSPEIRQALQQSPWVIFLASRAACSSPYVQQEIGGAIFGNNKKLVPVIWDISPEELPGWAKEYQVLDLRGLRPAAVPSAVQSIAQAIQADKRNKRIAFFILAALLTGLVLLSSEKE